MNNSLGGPVRAVYVVDVDPFRSKAARKAGRTRQRNLADGHETDSQKGKLYKAEKVLAPMSKRLPEVKDIEKFVKKALGRATIQRRYGRHLRQSIQVKPGRNGSSATGGYWSIKMPPWSRTEYIVLHELAHTLTQRIHGFKIAGHGWQYAGIYLDLVRYVMGKEAGDALKASFREHKVRFRPKKKVTRQVDRAELVARMAKAREARAAKLKEKSDGEA